ncbi:DUF4097 family beta strand repeat protein [Viridibacillus sp. YIM B01967]|uniref:DUF4097 family beta strand repeat protein n=1 Tax=Viridibacillus soli TaxID=2798301 RepID=A0ABS1H532_9BACL|nr:DUF4097 family beta strand repeat-containing protein [Viridibacillus soli]MBK3494529.1 DUF4097 family beta strand repeat protein [Viridibacillus soli]
MKKLLVSIFLLAIIIISGFNFFTGMKMKDALIEKKIAVKDVDTVEILSSSIDIKVVEGSGDEAVFTLSGKTSSNLARKISLDVKKSGHSIVVNTKFKRTISFFNFNKGSVHLKVALPKAAYEKISVNTSSGDVAYVDVAVKDLTIQTASGDIAGRNITADDDVELTSSSGDIIVQDMKMKNIIMDATSGDITGQSITVDGDAKLTSSSGDISTQDLRAKRIEMNTTSGDVAADYLAGEINAKTSSGDIAVLLDTADEHITLSTSSGDATFVLKNKSDNLGVDFRSNSGDGTVIYSGMTFKEKKDHRIIGGIGSGNPLVKCQTSSGDFELIAQ